jgi:gliding motility-associated-like protein
LKQFLRIFSIFLALTFGLNAIKSYGQDQNGLYLSVVKQTPPSSSSIEICSAENIALYGNTSGNPVSRMIFEFYNKTNNRWEVLSSTFRNFDFSNVGAYTFKEALPDNSESQDYRLRYFINQTEYITPTFSINVRPGSSAGGVSPRSYTICNGATPPSITLIGTVGTNIRWQSSFTSITGTYTDMSPAITTATLPGSAINKLQTGFYRAIVQNSYCTPDTLSVPITINVTPLNTLGLSSASATESQTVCINNAITPITYSTTGANGASVLNLPPGVTGSWASNVLTISGTTTTAGTYTYTVTTSGGCGVITTTGTIVVTPNNTISLSSAAGTASQTVCINVPVGTITYTTTGATGANFSNLPPGVSGTWANNLVTISGTPNVAGNYNYTITLTGGCGVITKTGTILVNPNNTITLSSAAGTDAQTICINGTITPIRYTTNIATGATVSGLPPGITGSWNANVFTITGTANTVGTYNYTVTTTGGCSVATISGTIVVLPNNTISFSSVAGSNAQTVCINTAITAATYTTTGATGASVSNLPPGVSATWANNVVTISGTPTVAGTYTYTVSTGDGCGVATAVGTIVVNPNNTITLSSAAWTNAQVVCINSNITSITYTTTIATGATVTGLPPGVTGSWNANIFTISGTPTATGVYNYTVTTTGGCSVATASGTIAVTAPNSITLGSVAGTDVQTVCINTAITAATFSTTGATGAVFYNLPPGVTGSWANNVATVSGTPTVAGTYNYTVATGGGCFVAAAAGTIIVTPNNTITLSSATGTDAQSLCINIPATNITYNTTGATGATFSNMPPGVTGGWSNNVVTISGTPTVAGNYTYTITLTGGCGIITKTGSMSVLPNNTISLSSANGTNAQTVCINTAITATTYTTTGATGATVSGLPTGVSGSYAGNTFTINGTPTVAGTYTYTITTTGGCSVATISGSIEVTPNNTVVLSSATGTDAQTVCINTAISNATYTTTGATGANFTNLPNGVTGTWSNNVVTISGTPTIAGTYTYTITLLGGCGIITKTGTIVVNQNTIVLSSAAATAAQTICINTPATNIIYNTTIATGATVTGLPPGLTGSWSSNIFTISGTATATGSYNYTITTTGGCSAATISGTIVVTPNNTITFSSNAGTNQQTLCINTAITAATYTTTGATGASVIGLPPGVTGVWANNVVTITGTPTAAGTYTYTVSTTGGCSVASATGTIVVTPNNTITLSSGAGTDAQTICINTAAGNIAYATTGATGANFVGLPNGMSGNWSGNVVTISGTPTAAGTYNYTITLTGGCGIITKSGTITVNPNNSISLSSAVGTDAQSLCVNTAATNITYSTNIATGATISGLPTGMSGAWASNVFTITGTPSVSGTYSYTVTTTGGCSVATISGTVSITPPNTIQLSSAIGTNAQTLCSNTSITSTTYSTTGATGASFLGLPTGVTGSWANNVVTISGTPTVAGNYNYTVTLLGGCGYITATGTIVVNENTISLSSAAGSNAQIVCINTPASIIKYTTTVATGATVVGLPPGVTGGWSNNEIIISGTPTVAGTYTYTITTTGGCSAAAITGTMTVNPNNTIVLSSVQGTAAQKLCINTALTNITYTTNIATGAIVAGLPSGLSGGWSGNVFTISGTPTAAGTYTYTVTTTGGCSVASILGTVEVIPNNTITLSSAIGTDAKSICINAPITTITYTTTGATGANFSGLPLGVNGSWVNNVVTIAGTPTVAGNYNYEITLLGGCGIIKQKGIITVDKATIAGDIYFLSGSSPICNAGAKPTITIQNNLSTSIVWEYSPSTTISVPSSTVTYTSTSQVGNLLNTGIDNTATALNSSFRYYRAAVKNGACNTVYTAPIEIEVIPTPLISNPIPGERCGPGSVELKAQTNLGTVNWYDVNTGGTSLGNGNTFATPIISTSTKFYAGAIFRGCASLNRTEILATIKVIPSITSVTPKTNCGPGILDLEATASVGGTVNWYTAGVGGTLVGLGNKFSTPLLNASATYYVDAALAGCNAVTRTPVTATIYVVPIITSLVDTFNVCAGNKLNLKLNASLGLPPYTFTFYSNNGNVIGNTDGTVSGIKGGISNVYFNVKDMNGCVSQNTNVFKIRTFDPVLSKQFNYQAYYQTDFVIPTKTDSGYILYNWQPGLYLNFTDKPNPTFNGDNTTDYVLVRTDTTSKCIVADNYHIDVTRDYIFDLPNAFTPNNDGLNDEIKIEANAGIDKINYLRIYNRAGKQVFYTNNIKQGWDGRVGSVMQDADAYYWIAEYVTKAGQTNKKTGTFLLLK